MTFLWPVMLFLLLLVPLLVVFYLRMTARRRRLAESLGSMGFMYGSQGQQLGRTRHLPAALFLAGITLMLVAIARPQATVSLPRIESNVILAFDVSGSMSADDMEPTRMEAAKAAARDFISRQPSSVQIGVVAFSESGIGVQVPTRDQELVLAAIDRLQPQRGTSLANGIIAALKLVVEVEEIPASDLVDGEELILPPTPTPLPPGEFIPAVVVLLTDGENTSDPDPLFAAQIAADRGVRLYTIGIGSPAGAVIEVEGFSVLTQLDEGMLQQISQISDGEYFNAQSEEELREIYNRLDAQWVVKPEKTEITSLLAGMSLLALLFGGAFSLLWFNRLP